MAVGVQLEGVLWIVVTHHVTVTALIVNVGRLRDIFGRCRLLLAGSGLFVGVAAMVVPNL